MRKRLVVAALAALFVVPVAAWAATTLSYQGFTSQGHQISFKRSKAGVYAMKIGVRVSCMNADGQNQGDYDYTISAADNIADPVRGGRFTTKLRGSESRPFTVINGTMNRRGTARGTLSSSGKVTKPSDLGTCKSGTVRWTAGP